MKRDEETTNADVIGYGITIWLCVMMTLGGGVALWKIVYETLHACAK